MRESSYGLAHVVFPQIGSLDGAELTPFMPIGLGLKFDNPLKREPLSVAYPGNIMTQFMGAEGPEDTLYFGAHDPGAHHKVFALEPDAKAKQVCLRLEYPPAGAGHELKRWRLPYEVVLGPLAGDWYDAAATYRKWALKSAPWNSRRRLKRTGRIPRQLQEIDLWVCENGDPDEVVPKTKQMQDFFGVNTALHWYCWHQIPFDDQYPEYFPTKEGFAEGVAELKSAGIPVMPYINGRLWDPKTASWRDDDARASAVLDEKGRLHKEVYGPSDPLVSMCPHTPLWQDKIAGIVRRLFAECGVSGVYIDQIGIARSYPCYAANHGHPRGGGNSWWRGYKKLLQKCRKALGPGNFLTTEEACEPWNDLLDAFLMVNTTQQGYTILPIHSAIYGGQVIQFGFQYFAGKKDAQVGLPWRAKVGRNFLWGGQLGWVGAWILDRDVRKEANFLRDLARCRERVRDFFTYGQMLRPPEIPNTTLLAVPPVRPGRGPRQTIPAVMASAWKRGSSLMVALVNFTDRPKTVRLPLPRADYRLGRKANYRIARVTSDSEEMLGSVRGDPIEFKERLPARTGRALVLEPEGRRS